MPRRSPSAQRKSPHSTARIIAVMNAPVKALCEHRGGATGTFTQNVLVLTCNIMTMQATGDYAAAKAMAEN